MTCPGFQDMTRELPETRLVKFVWEVQWVNLKRPQILDQGLIGLFSAARSVRVLTKSLLRLIERPIHWALLWS